MNILKKECDKTAEGNPGQQKVWVEYATQWGGQYPCGARFNAWVSCIAQGSNVNSWSLESIKQLSTLLLTKATMPQYMPFFSWEAEDNQDNFFRI